MGKRGLQEGLSFQGAVEKKSCLTPPAARRNLDEKVCGPSLLELGLRPDDASEKLCGGSREHSVLRLWQVDGPNGSPRPRARVRPRRRIPETGDGPKTIDRGLE